MFYLLLCSWIVLIFFNTKYSVVLPSDFGLMVRSGKPQYVEWNSAWIIYSTTSSLCFGNCSYVNLNAIMLFMLPTRTKKMKWHNISIRSIKYCKVSWPQNPKCAVGTPYTRQDDTLASFVNASLYDSLHWIDALYDCALRDLAHLINNCLIIVIYVYKPVFLN